MSGIFVQAESSGNIQNQKVGTNNRFPGINRVEVQKKDTEGQKHKHTKKLFSFHFLFTSDFVFKINKTKLSTTYCYNDSWYFVFPKKQNF